MFSLSVLDAMEKRLKTVQEVIDWLKLFPSDSEVTVDLNPINGGSFEWLVKNNSPLDDNRVVIFNLTRHLEQ